MDEITQDIEFYLTRISFYDEIVERLENTICSSRGFGEIEFQVDFNMATWFREFWKKGLIEFMQKAIRKQMRESKDKKAEKVYQ